jgi:hypothetical protein
LGPDKPCSCTLLSNLSPSLFRLQLRQFYSIRRCLTLQRQFLSRTLLAHERASKPDLTSLHRLRAIFLSTLGAEALKRNVFLLLLKSRLTLGSRGLLGVEAREASLHAFSKSGHEIRALALRHAEACFRESFPSSALLALLKALQFLSITSLTACESLLDLLRNDCGSSGRILHLCSPHTRRSENCFFGSGLSNLTLNARANRSHDLTTRLHRRWRCGGHHLRWLRLHKPSQIRQRHRALRHTSNTRGATTHASQSGQRERILLNRQLQAAARKRRVNH